MRQILIGSFLFYSCCPLMQKKKILHIRTFSPYPADVFLKMVTISCNHGSEMMLDLAQPMKKLMFLYRGHCFLFVGFFLFACFTSISLL